MSSATGDAVESAISAARRAFGGVWRPIGRVLRWLLPPERARWILDTSDRHGWALLAVATLVVAALPFVGLQEGFYMTIASELFLFSILALSWDLVGGQTGYPSFGNMAFFGVGAYATAILVKDHAVAFPAAFVVAGLLALVFAGVIGAIVLRLRGGYFAIATLGVLLTAQQVSRNLEITGGSSGKILLEVPSQTTFYYVFLGVLVVEVGLVYYLSKTRFGYVLNAIRDDEEKATSMGFNTTYYKTAAWMLAALFTAFAGGTWSLFNTFIDPQTAYNAAWNVEIIAMSLLGGAGTVAGPVIGAVGLHAIVVIVETLATGWQLIVVGVIVIAVVIAFPRGAVGTVAEYASELEYYRYGGGSQAEDASETDGGGEREVTEPADIGGPNGPGVDDE